MSSDNGDVYILRETDDEEWVSPTPARTAVAEAVTAATDLDDGDVDDIEAAVDFDALGTALADDEPYTVTVAGHEVTVDPSGAIEVANED
jgi:hypothetical protein